MRDNDKQWQTSHKVPPLKPKDVSSKKSNGGLSSQHAEELAQCRNQAN